MFCYIERYALARSSLMRAQRARAGILIQPVGYCCARRIGPAAAEEAQKRARGAALLVPVGALPAIPEG